MKILFFLSLLFTFNFVQANTYRAQVRQIIPGGSNLIKLVFLSNGRILKTDDAKIVNDLKHAMTKKSWLNIIANKNRMIQEFQNSDQDIEPQPPHLSFLNDDEVYNPSILKSLDQARLLFYEAKKNNKESQCYNRAHVWAYDWRVKNNLYSEKLWIYFTPKYIREYDFDWWFHVAPMVHVVEGNEVKERVMDIKYARGPLKINQWSDIFMRNSAKCPVVEKYTDQADYPESSFCYLMKSSMYYYQPVDLENLEQRGMTRNMWQPNEVRNAFKEAFDIDL